MTSIDNLNPVVTPSPVSPEGFTEEERRGERRFAGTVNGRLMSLAGEEILDFEAFDVGEGGLSLNVPIGYGLAVGQRFEVTFTTSDGNELACVEGECRYATVLRTEMHADQNPPGVGVGLRFDQPLMV